MIGMLSLQPIVAEEAPSADDPWKKEFSTNLRDWWSDDPWDYTQKGYGISACEGLSFARSQRRIEGTVGYSALVYSPPEGGCLGLLLEFSGYGWYGAVIDDRSDPAKMYLFYIDHSIENSVIGEVKWQVELEIPKSAKEANDPWKLDVVVGSSRYIRFRVNDSYEVNSPDAIRWSSMKLGLLAVDSGGRFNEVNHDQHPESGKWGGNTPVHTPSTPTKRPTGTLQLPPVSIGGQHGSGNQIVVGIAIACVVASVVLLCVISAVVWKRRRKALAAQQPSKIDYFAQQDKLPPRLH